MSACLNVTCALSLFLSSAGIGEKLASDPPVEFRPFLRSAGGAGELELAIEILEEGIEQLLAEISTEDCVVGNAYLNAGGLLDHVFKRPDIASAWYSKALTAYQGSHDGHTDLCLKRIRLAAHLLGKRELDLNNYSAASASSQKNLNSASLELLS